MSDMESMLDEAVANGWRVLTTADGHFVLVHNGNIVVDLVPPAGVEGWGNAHPALIIQSQRRGIVGVGEVHGSIGEGSGEAGIGGFFVGSGVGISGRGDGSGP